MCFSNKGFLKIYSGFPKLRVVFFYADNSQKNYYDRYYDILHTIAPILRQC